MPVVSRSVCCGHRRYRGASLIEVLIAVLILGVGLLASSIMQASSLQANQDSHFRAQASALLEGMIDRMRGNPDGLAAGFYDTSDTAVVTESIGCTAIACTPAQLAQADIASWQALLSPSDGSLPALPALSDGSPARGTISAADGVYTVSVSWMARRDDELTDTTLSTRFRP